MFGHSLTEFCLSVVLLPTLYFVVRNAARSGIKNNVLQGSALSCGCCQEMGMYLVRNMFRPFVSATIEVESHSNVNGKAC